MHHRLGMAALVALTTVAGCRDDAAARTLQDEMATREERLETRRSDTSGVVSSAPLARWVLPPSLGEISGLALLPDGRLVAHDDERARVAVINPRTGVVLKEFSIGDRGTTGDFEGIAVAGDVLYLLTSRGVLYAFREGADHATVPLLMHDTALGKECEFEGVVHDPTANQLVMACKQVAEKQLRDHLVLYRIALPLSTTSAVTRLTVPIEQLRETHPWKSLHPTDITRDPATGNFVMVAAPERALIEITPDGNVVRALPLPSAHAQAEGVAITNDGVLIISDEAVSEAATITLYRWPLADTFGEP